MTKWFIFKKQPPTFVPIMSPYKLSFTSKFVENLTNFILLNNKIYITVKNVYNFFQTNIVQ